MFGGLDLEFMARRSPSTATRGRQIGVALFFIALGAIAASAGAYL